MGKNKKSVKFLLNIFLLISLGLLSFQYFFVNPAKAAEILDVEPLTGSHVWGEVCFNATTDPSSYVAIYIDDILITYMNDNSGGSGTSWNYTLDTSFWADGSHNIRFEGFNGTHYDNKAAQYIFDNNAPTISNITVNYPLGMESAKNSSQLYIIATVQDSISSIDNVNVNVSSVNSSLGKIQMYDDGLHADGAPVDGLYGSDVFTVDSAATGSFACPINANDTDGSQVMNSQTEYAMVDLDNTAPFVFGGDVIYPHAVSSAKYGDQIRILIDTLDLGLVSGIKLATANCSSIGGSSNVMMHDDGAHDDTLAGDGIYGSDLVTVLSGETSIKYVEVTAEDNSLNSDYQNIAVDLDNSHPSSVTPWVAAYPQGGYARDGQVIAVEAAYTDATEGGMWIDARPLGGPANLTMSRIGVQYHEAPNLPVSTDGYTGNVTLWVYAMDGVGNIASGALVVNVSNYVAINDTAPPTCEIAFPSNTSQLSGTQIFLTIASDDSGIDTVLIEIDNVNRTAVYSEGYYQVVVDVDTLGVGAHQVRAWVKDLVGIWVSSDSISFSVIQETSPDAFTLEDFLVGIGYLALIITLGMVGLVVISYLLSRRRTSQLPPKPKNSIKSPKT